MMVISVEELKERMDQGEALQLLDVREQAEFELCHLNAQLIPLNQLPERLDEIDKEAETVVYCHTGVRSAYAVQYLTNAGFGNVKNLTGGIEAWSVRIDPNLPRY